MRKLVLIDADRLCYLEKEGESLQEVIDKVNLSIKYTLEFTQADAFILFISEGRYFRHDLSDLYKSKRSYPQKWSKAIKAYLKAEYNATSYKGVEADDDVVYFNNKVVGYETIIVATDKDILYNIPGKHCNPSKKTGSDTWETVWIETTLEDSINHFNLQLLQGDSIDGIQGLKGIGPKKAEKLLELWAEGSSESFILNLYIEYYKSSSIGIYEFQKNYRLLKMLETDEDWLREVGYIPALPKINIVKTNPEQIIEEELNL